MVDTLTFATIAWSIIIMDVPTGKDLFCLMNNHYIKMYTLAKVFSIYDII